MKKVSHTVRKKKTDNDMFDSARHTTPFEQDLANFLRTELPKSNLTVDELKDIIYNEHGDMNMIPRFSFLLMEENPNAHFDMILEYLNEAWNHFPHDDLNGLAPYEIVLRSRAKEDFDPFEDRMTLYERFEHAFPERVAIKSFDTHVWQWEYPAEYHEKKSLLSQFQEEDDFLDEQPAIHIYSVRLDIAREVLKKHPYQWEAVVLAADSLSKLGKSAQALQTLEEGVFRARGIMPATCNPKTDTMPWKFEDNRPFLTLLSEYAQMLDALHGPRKAIPQYELLISLNPNDNQGIRSLLATAYLKTNALKEIIALSKKFPHDMLPAVVCGAMLAHLKRDEMDAAQALYAEYKDFMKNIFAEIVKSTHPQPKELYRDRITVGGEDDAWLYWQEQGDVWMTTPGAREWLKERIKQG